MTRTRAIAAGLALAVAAALVALFSLYPGLPGIDRLAYRVGAPATTFPAPAATPAGPDTTLIAVVGDVGTGDAIEQRTADALAARGAIAPYHGLFVLGDNVYPDGDAERLEVTVFEPFGPLLRAGAQLLPVLGNHDVREGNGPRQLARFGLARAFYARTLGDVQVIALDSNHPADPAQRRWLTRVLAGPRPLWRVVIMHHPMYSAGVNGGDGRVRSSFEELLVDGGVDLVVTGHDHDYQRSRPIRGIVHLISGGAARLRRTGREHFTAYSASVRHFVELRAGPTRMRLTAIDQSGDAFDDVFLPARRRPAQLS